MKMIKIADISDNIYYQNEFGDIPFMRFKALADI